MKTLIALMLMTLFSAPAFAAVKTSDKAPVFSLSDRSRKEHSLKEFLPSAASAKRGGVIVSFFASWCPPCRQELPILDSLSDELAAKGITIVLIAVREDFDVINPLLKQLKVGKPVVLSDREGKVSELYQVRYLPTSFFIGSDGSVKDIIFGGIDDQAEVRRSVEKLMR